jgi:hypothetical protein
MMSDEHGYGYDANALMSGLDVEAKRKFGVLFGVDGPISKSVESSSSAVKDVRVYEIGLWRACELWLHLGHHTPSRVDGHIFGIGLKV